MSSNIKECFSYLFWLFREVQAKNTIISLIESIANSGEMSESQALKKQKKVLISLYFIEFGKDLETKH